MFSDFSGDDISGNMGIVDDSSFAGDGFSIFFADLFIEVFFSSGVEGEVSESGAFGFGVGVEVDVSEVEGRRVSEVSEGFEVSIEEFVLNGVQLGRS